MSSPYIVAMRFDQKLRVLCALRTWRQKELVEQLLKLDFSVSAATVARWWNGQSDPRRKDLLILSRLLGVSIEMLARDDLDLDFRANGAATSSPHPAAEAKPSRPKAQLPRPRARRTKGSLKPVGL
jgi:transcriptional regulator with XRE-family HTH domain